MPTESIVLRHADGREEKLDIELHDGDGYSILIRQVPTEFDSTNEWWRREEATGSSTFYLAGTHGESQLPTEPFLRLPAVPR